VKVGQRVVPVDSIGTFQEYIVADQQGLVVLPDDVTDEAAAQFVVNPFSVYGMFNQAHLKDGDVVLITAAGSEVGRMVIHVGKLKGVKVCPFFILFFPLTSFHLSSKLTVFGGRRLLLW